MDELCGEGSKVVLFTRQLEYERSGLGRGIEEQTGDSQVGENLDEEWKRKLEEEGCEHDLELGRLGEEVGSGNLMGEGLEQKIGGGEKCLEQGREELLGKSGRFEELQGEMRK